VLTRIRLRNFRCLEDVGVPLGPLTAIVGPNGSGKTTILKAIELVLGDAWPSLRSFRIPQDFTRFDASRDLEAVVSFDPPYVHRDTHSTEHSVHALRLLSFTEMGDTFSFPSCRSRGYSHQRGEQDGNQTRSQGTRTTPASWRPLGQPTKGQKTQFGPLRVGTDIRDHARVLFIDHRRSLQQHLPTMRASILGRLLQPARKEFKAEEEFRKAYEQAMDLLRTAQVKNIETTVAETAKRMLGFLGTRISNSMDINFGFSDPANPFGSLRLQYSEAGLTVPGEELGLGIQSAIVVGIFEAFRQIGGEFGSLVIEEPEMYLHPQAQRYFYRLLCEMADRGQCQIIYATHSPIFADVNRFESLRLVRRDADQHSRVSFVLPEQETALISARAAFKLGGKFDTGRNEVLFADRALLVEGYGDRIAASLVAEKSGLDPDAQGVTIVDCGGKSGIELVLRVCGSLGIPCVVLHDEDVWPMNGIRDPEARKTQEKENADEKAKNDRVRRAAGDAPVFVISPSLEAAMGITRNASDKPRRIAEAMTALDVNAVPPKLQPLLDAVRSAVNSSTP
jgi:energy-coupling factor transporter ATP-binding protein EcfA2